MASRAVAATQRRPSVRPKTDKRSIRLSRVYQLLEPGPVVLFTTVSAGRPNVMPMSWHTMMEFEPPLVGCVISNRNYSFETLQSTEECVINIPTVALASGVVGCGNCSGRSVDKFKRFGLTPMPAAQVRAPLIEECYANIECKVVDTKMVPEYGFFVLEVVKAWIDPRRRNPKTIHHLGRGHFMVAGRTITLPSKKK
jgi:flavin reductase (DIM6/NTAB) family NADH-FMN oxidoreductase RutF